MSFGDIVSDIQNVPGSAYWAFMPSIGVEVLIKGFSSDTWLGIYPDGAPSMVAMLKTGASDSYIVYDDFNPTYYRNINIFIDNTMYIRMLNTSLVSNVLSYFGIQIK